MNDPIPMRPAGAHPTADELYQARQEPGTPGGAALLAHAASCARCSEELLRQEAFDHPEPLDPRRLDEAWSRFQRGEEAPLSRRARPSFLRPALLMAATLTAGVLGLSLWRLQTGASQLATPPSALPAPTGAPQLPPDGIQGQGAPAIEPGPDGEAEVIRGGIAAKPTTAWSPIGKVSAAPTVLSFPDESGDPVRATVFNLDHSYSWTSAPTTDGRVPFPESERRKLSPGVDYYWTVLGEGAERATVRFRIDQPKR